MTKQEVLRVVTHKGDCYRITVAGETFNMYVSRIGSFGLTQEASELEYKFVSYGSIEAVEAY